MLQCSKQCSEFFRASHLAECLAKRGSAGLNLFFQVASLEKRREYSYSELNISEIFNFCWVKTDSSSLLEGLEIAVKVFTGHLSQIIHSFIIAIKSVLSHTIIWLFVLLKNCKLPLHF